MSETLDSQNHPYIRKHFGNCRLEKNHPLRIPNSNSEYMNYVENILKELDGAPNLETKIKKMKKTVQWESILSELEFAKRVKSLNPEFVKEERKNGKKTPDLKVNLSGKELFFEIEMLVDNTANSRIANKIRKISSNLTLTIHGIIYDDKTADALIEFLKNKINSNETGCFSFEGINIEIMPTNYLKGITWFEYEIPIKSMKEKISKAFNDKLPQFMFRKPIFWIIDCKRFYFSHGSFETVLCDNKKGIFSLKDAECLTGIIAIIHGHTDLFLNPHVKQHLDGNSITQLKDLLSAKLYDCCHNT